MVSWGPHSPNGVFMGKLYKTKVVHCHQFKGGGGGQVRLGARPPPAARLPVQVQGEGLLPWSFGRLGQFLAHGHSDVLDPGPQPPGSKCTLSQSVSHNNIFGCIVSLSYLLLA